MALAVSGLPVDRFCFEGFLPRKPGERGRAVGSLTAEPRTMVFFEAPHRLGAMLGTLVQHLGPDRRAAVCRELTKTHEEVRRGRLAELATWAADGVRGEITVVVAGADPARDRGPVDLAVVVAGVQERVAAGERLKAVCAEESARTGLGRKELYDAVLEARRGRG
jgi:16S rRNA (cytidine1402-2'-O)-methyltransferase